VSWKSLKNRHRCFFAPDQFNEFPIHDTGNRSLSPRKFVFTKLV
jgi:hypothetical protein